LGKAAKGLGTGMSFSDPSLLDIKGFFIEAGKRIQSDAYWIVKLAFHPEMASLLRRTGGKHGAVKTQSGKN
jgi:hypothetical protein